jgi:hypothetical protein
LSRSIHTTNQSLRRLIRQRSSDPEAHARALEKARKELRLKRLIKQKTRAERHLDPPPLAATPVDTIPIEVEEASRPVFHALDESDVRALLRAVPDAAEGLSRVHLGSGALYIEQCIADIEGDWWERDPFTGRFGSEMMPGVYSAAVLGLYYPHDLSVHVHAFALDRGRFVLPERSCELFLRMSALGSLMHEIGHHHDFTRRRSRGRWLVDDLGNEDKLERHADRRAHDWTRDFVVPHLRHRRPDDVRELLDWLAERGGVRLSLEELVPDRGGMSAYEAVRCWLGELTANPGRREARTSLAEHLHLENRFEPCLRALDGLLAEDPGDAESLTLRADTLVHLERPDEALAIAEALRGRGIDTDDLWQVLCDALERLGEWTRLLEACERWCASRDQRGKPHHVVYDHRAVASAGLCDLEAAERWLKAWAESRTRPRPLDLLRGDVVWRLKRARRPPGKA